VIVGSAGAREPRPLRELHKTALRRVGVLALALAASALAWPALASAHGLVGRAYLPFPPWLFAWAAGAVLIVSFVGLGRLWSTPRLEHPAPRELFRVDGWDRFLEPACGAIGVGLLVLTVYSGIRGNQIPTANFTPTMVYVVFWVAVPVLSAFFGDLFRPFNPWRAIARAIAWMGRRTGTSGLLGDPLPYPEWLGRWPAVVGIFGFAWLELVFINRDDPSTLALLTAGYALVQLVAMAFFGIERWTERGDAFAVAFNLFAHLSPLQYRHGEVYWRRPLSGLTNIESMPGTAPLLCTMIGTTTFDGASNGPVWRSVAPSVVRDFQHLGLSGPAALEVTGALGIGFCILLVAGVYWLGIRGMQSVSRSYPTRELGIRFIHTIIPIAFGYLLAHYFSLLVTQGQATASLISNPLGTNSNLFGTAHLQVDWGLISAAAIWYVQVAALVSGHVSGLVAAHDRALVVYGDVEEAAESQRWMLLVMVTFTCFGLWLLSAVNT
jgi:hypothetical protein